MGKKKRVRNKRRKISLVDFRQDLKRAYTDLITVSPTLHPAKVADLAQHFAPWTRHEGLTPESFLFTKWGDAALDVAVSLAREAGLEDIPDEEVPEGIALHILTAAGFVGAAAFFWEMVLGFAYYEKLREKRYENEDIFHFLSTATFRYQFIYRALELRYPNDPQSRHAVCRYIASSSEEQADIQNDRITAHIMTELWHTGVNEFQIGPSLRKRFMLTDINNISADSVTFPYAAFIVETPKDTLMFTRVAHPETNATVWAIYNQERGVVQLRQDTDTDETLGDMWAKLPEGFWDNAPEAEDACHEAFQLICNLLLYLQCKDAEVETRKVSAGRKPPERKQRELRQYGKRKITPIKHVLYPSIETTERLTKTGDSDRTTREHWVRGHYRWQPYWPDGRDADPVKKRIWIEPHLRGTPDETADDEELSSRKYSV